MSASCTAVPTNQLLASLPPEAAERLYARLEGVELAAGDMLFEAGSAMQHVYFPVTATVSLVLPLQDGSCAEVAVVGREGVVGVCAFLGGASALSRAVVQRQGLAWRMRACDLDALAHEVGPVMRPLLRYTQALFAHMAQTSACHRHHELGPQLCRWLLQHLDRQAGDELQITQERIAILLGARREGITMAALKLQAAGLIRYRRGRIQVLDRRGLEAHSCECYHVVRQAYDRLDTGTPPQAASAIGTCCAPSAQGSSPAPPKSAIRKSSSTRVLAGSICRVA